MEISFLRKNTSIRMVYISSFGVELFLNLMRENRALEPRTKIVLKADLSQKILPSDYGVKESGRQKRKEEEEKEEEKKTVAAFTHTYSGVVLTGWRKSLCLMSLLYLFLFTFRAISSHRAFLL